VSVDLGELKELCISELASVRDAMAAIDTGGVTACLAVSDDGELLGLLTDGDLRRLLLGGAGMDDAVAPHLNRSPRTVTSLAARSHVLDAMAAWGISHLPIVDDGLLIGLHTLGGLIGRPEIPNSALVMAGGRGTRLGALTESVPKPLMTVAGRSILEWIVLELVGAGITDVWVSVGHMADQIVDHLRDGEHLGCRVRYLHDTPGVPLGTAGALSLLHRAAPDLAHPLIAMNGDLMVRFRADALLAEHTARGSRVTVGTRRYGHRVPYGVIDAFPDGAVRGLVEKPELAVDVSAGIYVLDPDVIAGLPVGVPATMPDVIRGVIEDGGRVGTWRIEDDWIDVGTPTDLARAKGNP
jgi:dTDP-glucose pyrophosphorylase